MPETTEQYLQRVTTRTVTQAVHTLEEASHHTISTIDALRMLRDETMSRIFADLQREEQEDWERRKTS